jgi:hypothetical protein
MIKLDDILNMAAAFGCSREDKEKAALLSFTQLK